MKSPLAALAAMALVIAGCTDSPTAARNESPAISAARRSSVNDASQQTSAVRWNRTAIALFRARGGNAGRINAYVALAQFRAALAAADARHGSTRPSVAGAVAGASVVVLKQFFSSDAAAIDAELANQRATPVLGEERNKDFAAGEAIGREIGAAVLALAVTDNFGLTSPGSPPGLPHTWTSSGAPIVRGGLGARPFFLTATNELRSQVPAPPAYGSAAFLQGLAEVRTIALTRTAAQTAITLKWVPFSGPVMNGVVTDLIDKYHRSELEAARILAYANVAAFDAIIACFDVKFVYWYIRPTQEDPTITLATGLPNHPSYPSAHSCETGAFQEILVDAFPSERAMLDAVAQEASLSRVYGGIHYRFDGDAGLNLGRLTARIALARGGLE